MHAAALQQHITAKEASAHQPAHPSWRVSVSGCMVLHFNRHLASSHCGSTVMIISSAFFPTTESCKRGGSRGHACLERQTLVRYPSSHCCSLSRSGTLQPASCDHTLHPPPIPCPATNRVNSCCRPSLFVVHIAAVFPFPFYLYIYGLSLRFEFTSVYTVNNNSDRRQ